ncbi:CD82 antigen C33 antigen IA4 Inducible membrane protein R2 [Channa argus]|uniref:CD82 antigen C33 antigen IA4 Inducible membrane protein R2 n=1 Tax=Channa argus TaxID=215402 RepID=A0A6G1PQC9_CHAAH|nr:CD82 antigen C33 antigen IA4 Inducible membrane protein R2 [Channa argus]KAK2909614.1 hypothetical protein Q8A73_007329 [Channa argus]
MKLELKIQLLKFCSAVFNSIYLLLGLAVGGCGIWILFDHGNFLTIVSSVELRTVALGLLVIGGVAIAVGVIGCVAAEGKHRFLLLIYLAFLIILILGQLLITLLLLINRNKIEQGLDEAVDKVIFQFGANSADKLMDNVQHYGKCCGRTGPADWLKNSYIQTLNLTNPDVLPCSCFSSTRPSFNSSWCSELLNFTWPLFGQGNKLYDQGCKQKLSVWLRENSLTIVGMDISLILIQVVQFVVTIYLYRALGRKSLKKTSHLVDSDHTPSEHLDDGEQNYIYGDPAGDFIDPTHPTLYNEPHMTYHHDNRYLDLDPDK